MTKSRKNIIPILIDIRYQFPINRFEEFYGDNVTYAEIEQTSYIDLKEMVFEKVSRNIKFRKFIRENGVLTIKAEMLEKEYEKFLNLRKEKAFKFLHDFTISNVILFTDYIPSK